MLGELNSSVSNNPPELPWYNQSTPMHIGILYCLMRYVYIGAYFGYIT